METSPVSLTVELKYKQSMCARLSEILTPHLEHCMLECHTAGRIKGKEGKSTEATKMIRELRSSSCEDHQT